MSEERSFSWILSGIIDVMVWTIIAAAFTGYQPLKDLVEGIAVIASLVYVAKVYFKQSWILKEAATSFGMFLAGTSLEDYLLVLFSILAIAIVMYRKFLRQSV